MQEGLLLQREYEEQQQAKVLYLLRYPAGSALARSQEKEVSLIDLLHIPQFDGSVEEIRKYRARKEAERKKKDEEVYRKYKDLENV